MKSSKIKQKKQIKCEFKGEKTNGELAFNGTVEMSF